MTPRRPHAQPAPARSGGATRQRLIAVAERLFARHGIDAVSLNQIVRSAEAGPAAIHYHFGNREGLIEAIIRERRPLWSSLGGGMIDDLEGRDEVTPREVVAVMVLTVLALTDYPWGEDYIRLVADLAIHRRYAPILHEVGDDHSLRYLKQLTRVTPDLPDDIRLARYAYLRAFVYAAVGCTDHRVALWLASIGESATAWRTDDLIDMMTGAMTAAVHHE